MKKQIKKLVVSKQTIRVLSSGTLDGVVGGWIRPPISWSCPQPVASSSNCPKEMM